MKDDCIFCKLANGVFPTRVVYEDETFTVIMDNGPVTKGHSLILPKEHYDNIYELPDEVASKALVLAKKMAVHMKQVLKADGFNVIQNNEPVAGQTVFHFHMHLIPRYENDGQDLNMAATHPSDEELDSVLKQIKPD